MRNNKRVRFFRRLIYAFIIILLFLPLILTSFLSMRLISRIEGVERRLGELELAAAAAIPTVALPATAPFTENNPLDDPEAALPYSPNGDNPLDDPVPEEDGADTQPPAPIQEPAPEAPKGLQSVPAPLTGC